MHTFTDIELAKRYHGHLGPNLIIGIKMGNYALGKLDARSHFGIEAEVHCPEKPPVSCMIDGVQLSTGATMGKANIRHIVKDGDPEVVFTNTDTQKSVRLRVVSGLVDKSLVWYKEIGEHEASMRVWEMDAEEVFSEIE